MIRPDEDMNLDLRSIDCFDIIKPGTALMKFMWEGIEVTLYRNGGMVFYHFEDQEAAERHATEIWKRIGVI